MSTLDELKARLMAVIDSYKQVSSSKNTELKASSPAPAAKTLSGSVGDGGDNKPADVMLVKSLLNRYNAGLTPDDPNCGPKTIAAIKKFQQAKVGLAKPDGVISPNGRTWQALNGQTAAPQPNPQPQPAPAAKQISASVGSGGINKPEDVMLVKELLNKLGAGLTPTDPNCGPKTVAAIKKMQFEKAGIANPNGIINPGDSSWKALNGQAVSPAPNPQPNPNNGGNTQPNKDGKEQTLGGADDATELKLQEFMQNMSNIQVEIAPGQIVGVRPPYHINAGDSAKRALANRSANPKVANIIKSIGLGGSAGDGKATPEQMKKFLEECIKQGLIPAAERTAKGLRDFLDKFGVSTDCSGLALQGINFLNDGDMQRDGSDVVGIMNTAMIRDAANKGVDFSNISSPNALKAGDMMNLNNGEVYHVRLLIDVDKNPDGSVEFTTVESTGSAITAQGDGVGQRRWKFPNGAKFEGLLIKKDGQFVAAGANDRKYPFVRHKSQK